MDHSVNLFGGGSVDDERFHIRSSQVQEETETVTKFMTAVKNLQYLQVKSMIDFDPTIVNAFDNQGFTGLHYAVKAVVSLDIFSEDSSLLESSLDDEQFLLIESSDSIHTGESCKESFTEGTQEETGFSIIRLLWKRGANVNAFVKYRSSPPLVMAVNAGHKGLVQLLCEHGANLELSCDMNRVNALELAAGSGQLEILNLLLSFGSRVNKDNEKSSSSMNGGSETGLSNVTLTKALHAALINEQVKCAETLIELGTQLELPAVMKRLAKNDNLQCLQLLLDKKPDELKSFLQSDIGGDALLCACQNGSEGIVDLLLQAGADPNRCDSTGKLPLLWCWSVPIAELLIQYGAHVNRDPATARPGQSPLSVALRHDYYGVAQTLIHHGAHVEDSHLMTAVSSPLCTVEIVLLLIQSGASVSCISDAGESTLHAAMTNIGKLKMAGESAKVVPSKMASLDVFQILIDNGADINHKNARGQSPLAIAAKYGCVSLVKLLTRNGALLDQPDIKGDTALLTAIRDEDLNSVLAILALLEAGADVNWSNPRTGETALSILLDNHIVSTEEWCQCLNELVSHGACTKHDLTQTLAEYMEQGDEELVFTLMKAGVGPRSCDHSTIHVTVPESLRDLLTPFCLSLVLGRDRLAQRFAEVLFLTNSDISIVLNDTVLKDLLSNRSHIKCLGILLKHFSSPLSLYHLSFVTVSSVIGPHPGRKERLMATKLPPSLQRKLMFQ